MPVYSDTESVDEDLMRVLTGIRDRQLDLVILIGAACVDRPNGGALAEYVVARPRTGEPEVPPDRLYAMLKSSAQHLRAMAASMDQMADTIASPPSEDLN